MKELIRHILKESSSKIRLLKVIKDEGIFSAAELVGGMDNLKRMLKDEPEMNSLFDKLTGRIIFDYYVNKEHIEFPLDYEIIGRKSNIHKTNHWPEINVLYDENKLTPEENGTFKSMIKNLADDAQHSGFKSKFDDGRIFNANYLTVVELNGENIDSIWGGHYPWIYEVEEIYDKLYGRTETLNESEEDPTQKILNFLLRRYKVDEVDLGWAGHPIKLKMIKFEIDGESYSISTFENKRQQIVKILDMLKTHNIIEEIDQYEGKLDPYTQKVIRSIKQFINQVM
jgi:hypothetical protein